MKYVPNWKEWNDDVIAETHGDVRFYRDLFYGNHGSIFERAKQLIKNGEIVDNLFNGRTVSPQGNVRTPYLVANACKVICKVPASMVSRSVGKLTLQQDQEFTGADGIEYLSDILEDIERASGFKKGGHFTNILQHQIDGGVVGIPIMDDNGVRIDFKKREVYFPHEDGLGCDLAFKRMLEDADEEMQEYLHVHRQRVEDNVLTINEYLYDMKDGKLSLMDESEAAEVLEVDQMEWVYEDRNRPLIVYWANEATFDFPLGTSALLGQENKQDEINWTLTRNGITFERNGKPRIAVSKQVMAALQQKALDKYQDETMIDHRDLEVTTMDDNGKALEVIQIDITKIGDIKWVKDLMKMMFIETETSEKAVDFYLNEGGASTAASGIAKFYDLFTSIVKSERLVGEYIDFIQELVENCLWLMSREDQYSTIEVVRPTIQVKDMIPSTLKERVETEALGVEKGVRSKEKAVAAINEHDSDDAIEQELDNIAGDLETVNSQSQSSLSLNSISTMLDNQATTVTTPKTTTGDEE